MDKQSHDASLREHLIELLEGGHAHPTFEMAIAGLDPALRGAKPPGQPHTPWRLLEHMRIAQWDILEFTRNPDHVSPEFPDGYWPTDSSPSHPDDWERSVERFRSDLRAMTGLATDPGNDLHAPIPHGQGQTILREVLLVADHNAYHIGQLILVRRLLGAWNGS